MGEAERNDRVWGVGNWVHCDECGGVHHVAYHDRALITASSLGDNSG